MHQIQTLMQVSIVQFTKKTLTDFFFVCVLIFQDVRRLSIFVEWLKRLNLFKKRNDRSEDSIKQQKIVTYVYLVLLTGIAILSILP
jgi:hypothetical protein